MITLNNMPRLPSETFEIGDRVRVKDNPEQYDIDGECINYLMGAAGGFVGTIREYNRGYDNTWYNLSDGTDWNHKIPNIYYIDFDEQTSAFSPDQFIAINKSFWFGECLELLYRPTPISKEEFLSIFD